MPRNEGNYLVAFDDGAVETFPMSDQDIKRGEVRDGQTHGLLLGRRYTVTFRLWRKLEQQRERGIRQDELTGLFS